MLTIRLLNPMATTHVMIVEDEALVAVEIRQKLEQIGFEVISMVTSGEAAVQKAVEDRPDVILMDIRLPGALDGIAAAEQIRPQYDIPVIYLTAHADVDSIARAKLTEPFGYLLKPVQRKELQVTIDNALYKHKLQTELQETNWRLEHEIAERKRAEEKIRHINAILRAIRNVNQLITHEKDRDRLLQRTCEMFIESRGFSCAKIALMSETGDFMLAAESGLGEQVEPLAALLEAGTLPYCFRQSLASAEIVIVENPLTTCTDCPLADLFEHDRKMTVRLEHAGRLYGLLIVSLPEMFVVDEEEHNLLQEVANDLAFALHDIELEQEHKRAEKALRDSEERYRSLFEGAEDHIFVLDQNFRYVMVNLSALKAGGFTLGDVVGKGPRELFPEDAEFYISHYRQAFETGKPVGFERELRLPDGARWFSVRLSPIKDVQGHVIALTGISRDITKQKQAEKRIKFLAKILSSSPLSVIATDKGGKIVYVNPATESLFGYTNDELLGKNPIILNANPHADKIQRYIFDTVGQGKIWRGEILNKKKNGEVFPLYTSVYQLLDDEGNLIALVGFQEDITERKQAEETRRLLESAAETTPLGVTISDKEGKILYANPAEARMHGYAIEDLIGQNANMLAPQELRQQMPAEQIENVVNWKRESLNIRKDGSVFPVQLISTAVKDASGVFLGLVTTCENITARKQAEEALRESHARLLSILENTEDIICLRDPEGRLVFYNTAFAKIIKKLFNMEAFIGMKTLDFLPEEIQNYWNPILARVLSGECYQGEFSWDFGDNDVRYYEISFNPVQKDDEIIGCAEFTRDITERKQAQEELQKYREHLEELVHVRTTKLQQANRQLAREIAERRQVEDALQKSEGHFRTISDLISDYAYVTRVGLDGELIREWVTDAFTRITGYTPEEMDERGGWNTIVHPDDRNSALQHRQEFLSGSETITEYRIITKHDDVLWLRDYARPVWDECEGRVVRIFGAVQDVTERKRAEEALREERDKARTYLEVAGVIIVIIAADQTVSLINRKGCEILGYKEEEILGKNWFDSVIPEKDREEVQAVFEQVMTGEIESVEYVENPVLTRSGKERIIAWHNAVLRDKDGRIMTALSSGEDITERKRAEEALHRAKEAAEMANRTKSEFLANMSHDIRTPMNAILGFSEILKEQLSDFPQYHSYLNGIINGGRTLLRLINDILDLSKIEAGRLEIKIEAVNLPVVLTEIGHMFSAKAREKGIRFKTVSSLDVPTTVLLDGTRLRQILANLVGNAIKFTKQGSVTLEVRSSRFSDIKNAEAFTTNLLFEVRDTGIGIPPEEQQRIFDPFQQHTRSFGGTGLGLAITKRLVELMNGSISVESTVNEGSVFRVLFPEIRVTPLEEEGAGGEQHDLAQIQFHGATILLVEDNASNRGVIRAYLASYDLHLVEAENGQKALELLKSGRTAFPSEVGVGFQLDLILMDIHMPVMEGDEVTRRLKADPDLQKIPVVALTAYAMKEQQARYQDLFDAYLSKPIAKHDLITTLAQFLPHTNPLPDPSQTDIGLTENLDPSQEGRSFLEDLKAYTAQADPFPQALLDTLQTELVPRHTEVSEVMSIGEMIAFAEAIITSGDTFAISPLKHYGEELLRYVKVFDIMNMKRLLALFPDIVAIIRGR